MNDKKQYTIVVFSDSHGVRKNIEKMLPAIRESDYLVYLGDGNRDIDRLQDRIPVPIVRVRGNCDLCPEIAAETVLTVGNTRFLITHGNAYGVKSSTLSLVARAREQGCEWALYGHTHRAKIWDAGGVTICNPGAASGPTPSCALIKGDGNTFFAEIVSL